MADQKQILKGKVTRPFKVSGGSKKKDQSYKLGDSFTTTNKKLYDSLIDKKRIK